MGTETKAESNKTAGPIRRTEWNMAEFDLIRYDEMLKLADRLAIEIRAFDPTHIIEYNAILQQIYVNFKPIARTHKYVELDQKVQEIQDTIIKIKKKQHSCTFKDLLDMLDIHAKLLDIKQELGLGVPVKNWLDEKAALRESLK